KATDDWDYPCLLRLRGYRRWSPKILRTRNRRRLGSPRTQLSTQTSFADQGKTWPVRNRNGCRIPSQSGLNPKYRVDNSRQCEGVVSQSIFEEFVHSQFVISVLCVLDSGLSLNAI